MSILIISHPDCNLHEMGDGHPESPFRLDAIASQLKTTGMGDLLQYRDAPMAGTMLMQYFLHHLSMARYNWTLTQA